MTIGSRAADAPLRSTAEAVNNDKRDLPILVMFADVSKNERRELKTIDGVKVARKKVRIAAAVSKKKTRGQFGWEEAQNEETRANLEGNLAGGRGLAGRTGGLRGSTLPINQSPRIEDAPQADPHLV